MEPEMLQPGNHILRAVTVVLRDMYKRASGPIRAVPRIQFAPWCFDRPHCICGWSALSKDQICLLLGKLAAVSRSRPESPLYNLFISSVPQKLARIFIDFAECRLGATAICRGPAVRVPGGKNRRSSRPKPFPHASDSRPHAQAEGRNRPPFSQHTE